MRFVLCISSAYVVKIESVVFGLRRYLRTAISVVIVYMIRLSVHPCGIPVLGLMRVIVEFHFGMMCSES